ncbi:hypothetical protein AAC387_Pa01g1944 [Persea americana]
MDPTLFCGFHSNPLSWKLLDFDTTLLRHPPLKGGFSLSKGLGDVILHEILDCHRMIRSSIELSIFGLGYALDLQPQASTVQMESEMQ